MIEPFIDVGPRRLDSSRNSHSPHICALLNSFPIFTSLVACYFLRSYVSFCSMHLLTNQCIGNGGCCFFLEKKLAMLPIHFRVNRQSSPFSGAKHPSCWFSFGQFSRFKRRYQCWLVRSSFEYFNIWAVFKSLAALWSPLKINHVVYIRIASPYHRLEFQLLMFSCWGLYGKSCQTHSVRTF